MINGHGLCPPFSFVRDRDPCRPSVSACAFWTGLDRHSVGAKRRGTGMRGSAPHEALPMLAAWMAQFRHGVGRFSGSPLSGTGSGPWAGAPLSPCMGCQ
jgi:hypothetical protein